jgi:hypothetical protein
MIDLRVLPRAFRNAVTFGLVAALTSVPAGCDSSGNPERESISARKAVGDSAATPAPNPDGSVQPKPTPKATGQVPRTARKGAIE